jgi:hypothetical protein
MSSFAEFVSELITDANDSFQNHRPPLVMDLSVQFTVRQERTKVPKYGTCHIEKRKNTMYIQYTNADGEKFPKICIYNPLYDETFYKFVAAFNEIVCCFGLGVFPTLDDFLTEHGQDDLLNFIASISKKMQPHFTYTASNTDPKEYYVSTEDEITKNQLFLKVSNNTYEFVDSDSPNSPFLKISLENDGVENAELKTKLMISLVAVNNTVYWLCSNNQLRANGHSKSQAPAWDALHSLTCILERSLCNSCPPTTS